MKKIKGDFQNKKRIRNNKKYTLNFKKITNNIFILFVALSIFGICTSFNIGKKQSNVYEIQVQGSDTIWNIADGICYKNKEKNLNIQNIVIEIKELNSLTSSQIYEGQVLSVPIY
ncbi:MAG: hypothetical protein RSE00_03670 [Clostridia bacterium]